MSPELLRALVTIAGGSLAGGLTNTLAVWMLFHPAEPPRVLGRPIRFLHGAIPRNQDRLAEAVGRTVGTRLLTPDDLQRILAGPEFRGAFDRQLAQVLEEVLDKERGSVRSLLPEERGAPLEAFLGELLDHATERISRWLHTDEAEARALRWTEGLVERIADEPVGRLLTPEREERLLELLEAWVAEAVEQEGFRRTVDDALERGARALLREDRTFEEVLPQGLSGSLERALSEYLPVVVQRLGRLLEDPVARARMEGALRDLFRRLVGDLRFHQRLVARLVVNEDTLDRVLTTLEEEGADRLSEMLRDPELQRAMARGVNEALMDLMRRPVTSVVGTPDDPTVVEARDTLAGWVVQLARDPETRTEVAKRIRAGMDRLGRETWGDLLSRLPREEIARALLGAARTEAARRALRDGLGRGTDRLLDRPLGRPASWLPEGARDRIAGALADPLWSWVTGQVPAVVETLDVERRVEEKVRTFPTSRMEEIVRRVTERELRLIIRLGYLLGAIIGGILVGANALLG
ncbi:MAG: DUF445 family protein [Gemmatimonadales bacterium]|nr:MAG: DUF445 family protein [Gemmatimonadales bacterium]